MAGEFCVIKQLNTLSCDLIIAAATDTSPNGWIERRRIHNGSFGFEVKLKELEENGAPRSITTEAKTLALEKGGQAPDVMLIKETRSRVGIEKRFHISIEITDAENPDNPFRGTVEGEVFLTDLQNGGCEMRVDMTTLKARLKSATTATLASVVSWLPVPGVPDDPIADRLWAEVEPKILSEIQFYLENAPKIREQFESILAKRG